MTGGFEGLNHRNKRFNQRVMIKYPPAPDGKGRGARAERKRGTDREGSPGQPVCGGISPRKKNQKYFFGATATAFYYF